MSLRFLLAFDALTCGAMSLALLAGAVVLDGALDLPTGFLVTVGALLIPWTAYLAWLARQDPAPRSGAGVVIAGNIAWVVASAVALAVPALDPNGWGIAVIAIQAVAVAGLAAAQVAAARQGGLGARASSVQWIV